MIEIIPTWVPTSEKDIAERMEAVRSFAGGIHLDIDDGVFTPVLSWPYERAGEFGEISLPEHDGFCIEVHAMVEEPRALGLSFARALAGSAGRVIGHVEGFADGNEARGALDLWRREGAREAGLSILLDTPLAVIEPLIPACDCVQVMSVATIGAQGAPFDPRAIARIGELRERFSDLLIGVDGGVSANNIGELARAGAQRFAVGSSIAKAADPAAAYARLKELAESVTY